MTEPVECRLQVRVKYPQPACILAGCRGVDGHDRVMIGRLAEQVPATYMVFDLLQFEGYPTVELSYDERRHLLEGLALQGASWATPPAFVDVPGADVQRAARQTPG